MEKLLSVSDVSGILGIKVSTVYCWVWSKKLPYLKMGRLVKFRQGDIEKFIVSLPASGESLQKAKQTKPEASPAKKKTLQRSMRVKPSTRRGNEIVDRIVENAIAETLNKGGAK